MSQILYLAAPVLPETVLPKAQTFEDLSGLPGCA